MNILDDKPRYIEALKSYCNAVFEISHSFRSGDFIVLNHQETSIIRIIYNNTLSDGLVFSDQIQHICYPYICKLEQ